MEDVFIDVLNTFMRIDEPADLIPFGLVVAIYIYKLYNDKTKNQLISKLEEKNNNQTLNVLRMYRCVLELSNIARQANVIDVQTKVKKIEELEEKAKSLTHIDL